jgi:predicted O-linked N-acetylglucosamine transferase (SPINDLY family)
VSGLDPSGCELFAYHTGTLRDAATLEAEELCEHFVQGPLTFDAWRARIAADAPHILIYPEIGMDLVAARLAALRLAPVQCNSWGHPTTSGYPTLDYYLGSDLMEPEDGDRHYSERLVRLPGLSTMIDLDPAPEPVPTRQALGLPEGAIVYWCGQSLYKYLPQFDWLVPAIARGVPGSVFVFIEFADSPELSDRFRQRLESAFAADGLNATDHVRILPRLTQQAFAAALGQADVVLDSVGWSGCNSLFDALRHDLPIVTMPGALMRGRHGTAILHAIGVTETICPTPDGYVATAIALGRDEAFRARIRAAVSSGRRSMDSGASAVEALAGHLREWAGAVGKPDTWI